MSIPQLRGSLLSGSLATCAQNLDGYFARNDTSIHTRPILTQASQRAAISGPDSRETQFADHGGLDVEAVEGQL